MFHLIVEINIASVMAFMKIMWSDEVTHHIHYLLESETKLQYNCLRLVWHLFVWIILFDYLWLFLYLYFICLLYLYLVRPNFRTSACISYGTFSWGCFLSDNVETYSWSYGFNNIFIKRVSLNFTLLLDIENPDATVEEALSLKPAPVVRKLDFCV